MVITGGAGFIGTNVVRAALDAGWTVTVLDNFSTGSRAHLEGLTAVEVIEGDILDRNIVSRLLPGAEVVVHLAAQTGIAESMVEPERGLQLNAAGTLLLLAESVRAKVPRFILASTGGAIIGNHLGAVHEELVPRPVSPYGASKLAAEAYVHVYARSFGLQAVSLRFSNVYGPYSERKKNAIPQFIAAHRDGLPITIYGDGENTRDFLHVSDLADAVLAACTRTLGGGPVHLGTGVESSVNSLVATLAEVSGRAPSVRYEPARPGEVRRNSADIALARRLLDFEPRTDLRSGLLETWLWFQRDGYS